MHVRKFNASLKKRMFRISPDRNARPDFSSIRFFAVNFESSEFYLLKFTEPAEVFKRRNIYMLERLEESLVLSKRFFTRAKTFLQFPSRPRSRLRVTERGKTFSEQIGTGIA